MRFKLILAIVLLFTHVPIKAQNLNHFGLFPTIDHSGSLTKKLDYSFYYFGAYNLINEEINGIKEPGGSIPLSKKADKLYFSAYNEFFFNTYKAATAIYGENWAYAAVGFKTAKAGNFEVAHFISFGSTTNKTT